MPFLNSEAPDFQDIEGWINSEPASLKNGAYLLDFWTYSCRDCARKAAHLQKLSGEYPELNVVGVHSPQFGFERAENVEKAVEKLDIGYPVALDSSKSTTELYDASYTSRQILVRDGEIVWKSKGEDLRRQEKQITETLGIKNKKAVPAIRLHNRSSGVNLGFQGCKGVNDSGNFRERKEFNIPGNRKPESVYLGGEWEQRKNCLEAVEDSVLFYSSDTSGIDIVVDPKEGIKDVEVLLNGRKVPEEFAGEDLRVEDGRSYVRVKHPNAYNIVESAGEYDNVELMLRADKRTRIFELQLR